MRTRTTLGLAFLCTGIILLFIAYGRAGVIPGELLGQLGTPQKPRGQTEWVLQARFLQSAYLAGGGLCFIAIGGAGLIAGAPRRARAAEG